MFTLQHVRDFCGGCCFSGSLQTDHHQNRHPLLRKLHRRLLFTKQMNQLVMDNFNQLFPRLHGIQDIPAARRLADIIQKVFNDAIIDVRFQQCKAHFFQHVLHIGIA